MAEHEAYSLNVSYRWQAKPASVWAGESWQTHLRLFVSNSVEALGAGRVEPTSFGVLDASTTRTADNWSISQGWSGTGALGGGVVVTDYDIDAILSATKTWLTNTKTLFNNQYTFEGVRIYPMLKGGGTPFKAGVSATAPIIATRTDTTLDPSATSALPPDVALAVSLGTGTRGPSGRGRMFLGGIASTQLNTNGLINDAGNVAFGGNTESLLEAYRAIEGSGANVARFTPVIYTSRPNKSGSNADTGSVINLVRISDEWDTQRRRDRQRNDVYTNYALE